MARNNVSETKIEYLIPDDINANKGTEYGAHLMEKSLSKFGAGRSILLDKNNKIIAGNKTVENAGAIGIEDVIIVETTGNQIVAVKRMDIDLDTPIGRELALADNATAKANISFDDVNLEKLQAEFALDVKDWGVNIPDLNPDGSGEGENGSGGGGDDTYTNKIKAPIYEPKNEQPLIEELCDEAKTDELIKEIMDSDISSADKKFLRLAAKRHLLFNYEKIADYYAHSDPKVQELMEKSALVIIDFNKAIELGYVKMSEEMAAQYSDDYDDK